MGKKSAPVSRPSSGKRPLSFTTLPADIDDRVDAIVAARSSGEVKAPRAAILREIVLAGLPLIEAKLAG
jgi:hypothetical protein